MKCYSVIKGNEALTQATMWMTLENTRLSERSRSQKTTYCRTLYLLGPEQANL